MGRLIVAEFKDNETHPFDEIMEVFRKYPDFQKYKADYDYIILLPMQEGFLHTNRFIKKYGGIMCRI